MSEAWSSTEPAATDGEPVLRVDEDSSEEHLARAGEALARCEAAVMLGAALRIRPEAARLVCEVRDPLSTAHRCAMELEVLIENAQRTLEESRLHRHLPPRRLDWVIREGP